jgi:hypothetical protein
MPEEKIDLKELELSSTKKTHSLVLSENCAFKPEKAHSLNINSRRKLS